MDENVSEAGSSVRFTFTWQGSRVADITTNSAPINHFLDLLQLSCAYNTWVSYGQDLILEWTGAELLALYEDRQKTTRYGYNAFWAYLLFRGYRRETVTSLRQLPFHITREHRKALAPHRERLVSAQTELKYRSNNVGTELRLLISILVVAGKPLAELTRPDFNAFRDEYQTWYRETGRQKSGNSDPRLARPERYLEHWGVLIKERRVFRHEEHFASLRHAPIRAAITTHMQWCEGRVTSLRPLTTVGPRCSTFFLVAKETPRAGPVGRGDTNGGTDLC